MPVELRERRELSDGFANALTRAFELVVNPLVFAFLGWLLDGRTGTRPLFTVTFFTFVLGYEIWKLYRHYDARMDAHQQRLPGGGREAGR